MNLLDPDIQNYVFKWKVAHVYAMDHFVPEIQTEKEEPIGKIELKGRLLSTKYYLCNIEDSTSLPPKLSDLLYVIKNAGIVRESYDVKNLDDSLIGKVNKKSFPGNDVLIMKNAREEEILKLDEFFGLGSEGNYDINSIDGQNKAVFRTKQDTVKKSFWRYKYYNTCLLEIIDLNFDRKSLLGMFICCMLSNLEALEKYRSPMEGGG